LCNKWYVLVNTAMSYLQVKMVDKKLQRLLHNLAVIFMTSMRDIGARVWRKFIFFIRSLLRYSYTYLTLWTCVCELANFCQHKEKPPILVPLRTETFLRKHWRREDKIYFFFQLYPLGTEEHTYYLSYCKKITLKKIILRVIIGSIKHMHSELYHRTLQYFTVSNL
jgi:hypothetical protein